MYISSIKIGLIGTVSIIIFNGCFSTIKLENFKPKSMQKSAYMPTKEILATENKKVAIRKLDDSKVNIAKQLNLGEVTSQQLKSALSVTGTHSQI